MIWKDYARNIPWVFYSFPRTSYDYQATKGLLSLQDHGDNIVFIYYWISASSTSEQEEVNLTFWLATRAGKT